MSNILSEVHPELVAEWSDKNLPLTPYKITYGSNKVVWWKGACGHEWKTSVKARSNGENCPICSGARVIEGINDLATLKPALAAEWSSKNDPLKPTMVTIGSHKKVIWQDKYGHEWTATVKSRALNGTGCPYCSHNKILVGFNDLASQRPQIASEWSERNYPLKPDMVTVFANQKVWWRCSKGHEWNTLTDKNGVATFEDVLISGTTPYTIEEVDTAIRYVVPADQTAPVKWNEVTTRNFTNILKKFTVTVTKSDAETGTAQGNASLAGAKYGIFKGDQLIDEYYTDENGQFVTQEYICGSDWTIKELEPSEGYLLDPTVHKVGAEPELYTIEHNQTANDVTEQVIKGNIAIIKHTDDGETQIETPEEGWSKNDIAIYEEIKSQADKVVYTSHDYFRGCMFKRNRHLVNGSSVCIAYLTQEKGGTAYTVNYARQNNVQVINLAAQ